MLTLLRVRRAARLRRRPAARRRFPPALKRGLLAAFFMSKRSCRLPVFSGSDGLAEISGTGGESNERERAAAVAVTGLEAEREARG
jgi:hypothetical protein